MNRSDIQQTALRRFLCHSVIESFSSMTRIFRRGPTVREVNAVGIIRRGKTRRGKIRRAENLPRGKFAARKIRRWENSPRENLASGPGPTHRAPHPPLRFWTPPKKLVFSTFQMILSKRKKIILHHNLFFVDLEKTLFFFLETTCKPRSAPQG